MAKRKLVKPARKPQTMRDKIARAAAGDKTPAKKRANGFLGLKGILGKEFYLPLPDTKIGRFLNKRRVLTPKFLRGAVDELKQVDWPSRKETWRLTSAVFLFALFFAGIITAVDFVLDKIFRSILLK